MNIIEAAKSGKPFRRRCWHESTGSIELMGHPRFSLPSDKIPSTIAARFANFTMDDIVADDWEVKREPREWEMYLNEANGTIFMRARYWELQSVENPVKRIKVREVLE